MKANQTATYDKGGGARIYVKQERTVPLETSAGPWLKTSRLVPLYLH